MCGIIGLYDQHKIDKTKFNLALDKIIHRGPDNQSTFLVNEDLVFGHTRLSILDLEKRSNQPFCINDYTLTFNGEIYNYLELKKELVSQGAKFKTNSDTEVVLQSYIYWGHDCLKKFNGMWAFTIYDPIKNILFSSRDRYGIKPFYYYRNDGVFMFSSMISPIISYFPGVNKPDFNMINEFLYRGFISQFNHTWFKETKKLPPGHFLIYDFKNLKIKRYYKTQFKATTLDFESSKTELRKIFTKAVRLRMRSDVEVSSTLTSGIDSSAIVSVIHNEKRKPLRTYTVFSSDTHFSKNDKKDYNANVNLDESESLVHFRNYNINPITIQLDNLNYLDRLKECIKFIESGHASPAIVSIYELYRNVKKDNKKVLLEGQGADEIFGGYITDFVPEVIKANSLKINYLLSFFSKLTKVYSVKIIFLRMLNQLKKYEVFTAIKILVNNSRVNKKLSFLNAKKSLNLFDYHQFETLPNLLLYGDALSMANSVETRFPFLDYRMVDFANSLPTNSKIYFEKGKFILRESMKEILPASIYNSKIKNGFSTPIDYILKNSKEIKDLLYDENDFDFFEQKKLKKVLDNYFENKTNNHHFIFKILTTKIWFQLFCNKND